MGKLHLKPLWAALCGAALLLVGACGDGTQPRNAAKNDPALGVVFNRGNGAEPKSLDPALIDGIWEAQIVGDLIVGLTTEDASAKPIPGAAESWESSPDGLTWTFHLREHSWSDGVPVKADDFVYGWRRILDPKTAASYAYYLYPIKNARDVNTGKQPLTALGVAAPDDKTLVVTLEHAVPFMAEFVTHHTMYPVPRHLVEAKGAEWTRAGTFVSNGAYVLKEWIPNDHLTLAKNPKFYDAANVKIDTVSYYPTPDGDAALKRFRAGELDTQDPIPPLQIDFLRKNMPETLKIVPELTIFYASLNVTHKPLDDVRIREAINLAIDRETLVEKIIKLGEVPAYSMVPPGTANYPGGAAMRFKDVPFADRVAKAQGLMRAAGYGPEKPLHLRFATTTNAVIRQTIAPTQEMMRKIFIDLEVVQTDTQINYQKMQEGDFDIGSAGWIADYNDASNFLDVLRTGGGNNYGRYSNPKFEALLDKAAAERDLAKRGEILRDAEQLMLDDYPLLFIRFGTTHAMVQSFIKGWVANNKETNRSRWLTVEK